MRSLALAGRSTTWGIRGAVRRVRANWPGWLVVAALLVAAGRYLALVDRFSVDILFWDQWGLAEPIGAGAGPLDLFLTQHGPYRRGLGGLLTAAIYAATRWNVRAEAFAIGVIVSCAAAVFLLARRRLGGRLRMDDLAIPLACLSPATHELFVATPDPAYAALPLLFLALLALAWPAPKRRWTVFAFPVLLVLAAFTGYGVFAALAAVAVLAVQALAAARVGRWRSVLVPAAMVAVGLAAFGLYAIGYHFNAAVNDFRFPDPEVWRYPVLVLLAAGTFFGARSLVAEGVPGDPVDLAIGVTLGAIVLIAAAVVATRHLCHVVRRGGVDTARSAVIVVCVLTPALFLANMAIGRVSLGVWNAMSSRYVLFVAPLVVALAMHSSRGGSRRVRVGRIGLVVAVVFATVWIRPPDRAALQWCHRMKQVWARTYLETGSIAEATRRAGYPIYPRPEETHLEMKLQFLRERRLSFFRLLPTQAPPSGGLPADSLPSDNRQ